MSPCMQTQTQTEIKYDRCIVQCVFGCDVTYRSWNEKPGKQIPETEEKGHNNCSNLVAWSKCNNHHSVHREVDEAH